MIDTCTLYMLYHCLQLGSKLNMLKWAFLSENKIEIKKRGMWNLDSNIESPPNIDVYIYTIYLVLI